MKRTTTEDVLQAYRYIGVSEGDVLVIQSDMKGLGFFEDSLETLIEGLMVLVGTTGTLLMPAFNLQSWTREHYFDINETPSEVGVLAEHFRLHAATCRTRHPIHSFSVYGALRDQLCELNSHGSFDTDSVFGALYEANALYTLLGLKDMDQTGMVCAHHVEQQMEAAYRRHKDFSGIYVDEQGVPSLKTYSMYVKKDAKRPSPHLPEMGNHGVSLHQELINEGAIQCSEQKGIKTFHSRAHDYYPALRNYISRNPEKFS